MCIICDGDYDINMIELECCSCQDITEIPNLPNLKILDCSHTNITEIPNLPNLEKLYCYKIEIKEIPNLPNLEILWCYNTNITEIPNLPNLEKLYCHNTNITEIPNLPNLEMLYWDYKKCNNKQEVKELCSKFIIKRKVLNLYRFKKKLPTLWKIAEYYTAIKYHPDNINFKLLLKD